MKGKIIAIKGRDIAIKLQYDCELKPGCDVTVSKWHGVRSLKQNAFYWLYLEYCLEHGLKQQGHFSLDGLHEDIKAWIESTHKHDFKFKYKFSTTELNKSDFVNFLDIIDRELMVSFFGLDTSGFFRDYENWKEKYE